MKLKYLFNGIFKIYYVFIFLFLFTAFYPIYFILSLGKDKDKSNKNILLFVSTFHSNLKLLIYGVKVDVKGKHLIKDFNKSYVIVANHTSYLDIVIIYRALHDLHPVFLAKEKVTNIPYIGLFFKGLNVTVKRGNAISSRNAINQLNKKIEQKHSITIFPEGTISKTPPNLLRFKNGAFKVAIDNQLEIIPVIIKDCYKVLTLSPFFKGPTGPGKITVEIKNPIPTKGLTENDIKDLKNTTFEIIQNSLNNG